MLIINADDWGRNETATDSALECYLGDRISSVSGMVFMSDSERSAELALKSGIEVGLHLNFTEAFTGPNIPAEALRSQRRLERFLKRGKYRLILFHPLLQRDFRTAFMTQYEEYERLYQRVPSHINGHQHMHLCTNLLLQRVIPSNAAVRRSFSFGPGEKSLPNRLYRAAVDHCLARRYRLTDYFFTLPRKQDDLERIVRLSQAHNVELMTHPERPDERLLCMSETFRRLIKQTKVGGYSSLEPRTSTLHNYRTVSKAFLL